MTIHVETVMSGPLVLNHYSLLIIQLTEIHSVHSQRQIMEAQVHLQGSSCRILVGKVVLG